MKERRRLTLIIVPHDKLKTRSHEISYRRLKVYLGIASVLLVALLITGSMWWYLAAQAARVPGLERELARMESDQERIEELVGALAHLEAQHERVRQLLGAQVSADAQPELSPPPAQSRTRVTDRGELPDDIPGSWPLVQTGFITQEATGGAGEPHPGVDIAVPQDSYIRAAGDGVVRAAGSDEIYGRYVLVEHADGYETMYGHASQIFVMPGDVVELHEVIALSGSTGRSTAPHLHFEIRKDGNPIDPLPLLRKP
jgi:murein DD-endopeptidase MepM/ murein hydrolase activator NlpD